MSREWPRKRFIYFIRRTDGTGPIKIGCSYRPDLRVVNLGYTEGAKLEILASAPGDFCEERELHRQLVAHRVRREWFAPAPEVLSLLEVVKATGALPAGEGRNDAIVRRWLDGESPSSLAPSFELSRPRIHSIIQEARVCRVKRAAA